MTPPAGFTDAAATWNERFAGDDYVFGTEPNEYLRAQARRWQPGARLLCVADGEGRNSVWLARQGLQVEAFDIAEAGVRKARALARDAGVHVRHEIADVDGWPWPQEGYDGIAAIFVQFADPPMRERLFANMIRALAPGGWLVLQGYTPAQLALGTGGPGVASHLYTEPMLREAFAALEIVELVEYEADLSEGARHSGRSALVGMVARKPLGQAAATAGHRG